MFKRNFKLILFLVLTFFLISLLKAQWVFATVDSGTGTYAGNPQYQCEADNTYTTYRSGTFSGLSHEQNLSNGNSITVNSNYDLGTLAGFDGCIGDQGGVEYKAKIRAINDDTGSTYDLTSATYVTASPPNASNKLISRSASINTGVTPPGNNYRIGILVIATVNYPGGGTRDTRTGWSLEHVNILGSGPTPTPPGPTPTTPPQPGNFTLNGYSDCNASNNPRINLSWERVANGAQVLRMDGEDVMAVNGTSWSWSFPQSYNGTWHSYQIVGYDGGGSVIDSSDTISVQFATCGSGPTPTPTPTPAGLPDLGISGFRVRHVDGSQVTSTNPATPGESLRANMTILENNGVNVTRNFRISLWENNPNPLANCSGASANQYQTYSGLTGGSSTSETFTFSAPGTDGTYTARGYIDSLCNVTESDEDNTVSQSYYVVSPPIPPPPPTGLSATPGCTLSDEPQITFNWNPSTGADRYILDVTTAQWFGDGSRPPWAYREIVGGSTTSFTWSSDPSQRMTNGLPDIPVLNTEYWWRLIARNSSGDSAHVYPPNNSSPPGTANPVNTPVDCTSPPTSNLDLSASFVPGSWNKQDFAPNETATVQVMVTNLSSSISSAPSTTLGVWPQGSPLPDCPTSPQLPPLGQSYSVGILGPGNNVPINVSFNVGSTPGTYTAHAYVIPDCGQNDANWSNNSTTDSANISFPYIVGVDAWFATINGDIGSGTGEITIGMTPPTPPPYQSTYLSASGLAQTNIQVDPRGASEGWRITNYTANPDESHQLISFPVYDYLAERFKLEAINNPDIGEECDISFSPPHSGLNYCSGLVTIPGGNAPSGNSVWFIDGSLTITNNFTVGANDTIVFIVAGDITINTTVSQADGIYVTNSTFNDANAGIAGPQLQINGAVYANEVNLNRVLTTPSATCIYPSSHSCTNDTDPAEVIIFQPKYLVVLSDPTNNLLGSPAISWREIAP